MAVIVIPGGDYGYKSMDGSNNAEEFSFNSDNIAFIGYSAGGNLAATYINQVISNGYFPADYVTDEIDDRILGVGLIYPALHLIIMFQCCLVFLMMI